MRMHTRKHWYCVARSLNPRPLPRALAASRAAMRACVLPSARRVSATALPRLQRLRFDRAITARRWADAPSAHVAAAPRCSRLEQRGTQRGGAAMQRARESQMNGGGSV